MKTGLYFFEAGKLSGDRVNIYKDQIYIIVKKNNILNLLSNIIKDSQKLDYENDDTFLIGFAGELEGD